MSETKPDRGQQRELTGSRRLRRGRDMTRFLILVAAVLVLAGCGGSQVLPQDKAFTDDLINQAVTPFRVFRQLIEQRDVFLIRQRRPLLEFGWLRKRSAGLRHDVRATNERQ